MVCPEQVDLRVVQLWSRTLQRVWRAQRWRVPEADLFGVEEVRESMNCLVEERAGVGRLTCLHYTALRPGMRRPVE